MPISDFAHEILADLPTLISKHPNGVRLWDLQEEYGEQPIRILKACSILEAEQHIQVIDIPTQINATPTSQAATHHNYYIRPIKYEPPDFSKPVLTPLQHEALRLLTKIATTNHTTQVRTSYAQLARVLKCSSGGIRTCLERLQALNLIKIVAPSKQGKQGQLLLEVLTS